MSATNRLDIPQMISQMTLEEKASLLSGNGFWWTKGVERVNLPPVMLTDGPHGLRKQRQAGAGEDHLGIHDSIESTCFPTAAGLACSFDRSLMHLLGETLGEECQAEDVAVLLGPGANIKRSPLCGRNFEYFSEDPYLSGEMAAAHIRGVQSKHIGTSLKHYALNNQEHRRMSVDVRVDERAMREIYLASFEGAVKGGKPWTVMCSYNKVDGVYASENPFLLTQVLREEWGFDGFTVTDWGACADHVKGVLAGMDLMMPATGTWQDEALVKAVQAGEVSEALIDQAVARLLTIIRRYLENRDVDALYDRGAHHDIARRIARESMVLLKNDGNLLPLGSQSVAFIGKYAANPRYQGAGSSLINASRIEDAVSAVKPVADIVFAPGFDDAGDENPVLLYEAVEAAKKADVAVLFVGLPAAYESEGFDREHMCLPKQQVGLIEAVRAVNENVVVVLHNGSPVEMPWAKDVPAILEAYLGGQAVGGAVVDILFGAENPSGKLAETFPHELSDTPCYMFFPGDGDTVRYNESVYVGYRYYDTKGMDVLFPFGHGLSYTTFEYGNLRLSGADMPLGGQLTVEVDITNTGAVAGREIVQLYVRSAHSGISRPIHELRGFEKLSLSPGETRTAVFTLDSRAFAYWEVRIHDWHVEGGSYEIQVGASSRDIRLTAPVTVSAVRPLPQHVDMDTTLGDILALPGGAQIIGPIMKGFETLADDSAAKDEGSAAIFDAIARYMPLHGILSFAGGQVTKEMLQEIVAMLNR
ncbi:MAG: glycoside hydrolase family 3 C-terminal domain-containing protein [Clostridia bacterium]|nr:glycoside hydrolase family 3 C-terminal domain-containing protein [Clostridia bacterium]